MTRLHWDIYGEGDTHVCLVMGMKEDRAAWKFQVEHFGRDPRYSVLVMDNRGGIGAPFPGIPSMFRYSIPTFATDVLRVLDAVDWRSQRSVHLVGVSMGGMIALRVAQKDSDRLASLTLMSTAAKFHAPPQSESGGSKILGFLLPKSRARKARDACAQLFPSAWLRQSPCTCSSAGPDATHYDTNSAFLEAFFRSRLSVLPKGSLLGLALQGLACLRHNVTRTELAAIGKSLGHRTVVMTGDADTVIDPKCSDVLAAGIDGSRLLIYELGGHALMLQDAGRVNADLDRHFLSCPSSSSLSSSLPAS